MKKNLSDYLVALSVIACSIVLLARYHRALRLSIEETVAHLAHQLRGRHGH
jgi:hypothetical protein